MMLTKKSSKRLLSITLAAILLLSVWTAIPSQAAVPKLDTIRVAMFLQLPGKYTDTTAAATFSSAGGLQIGVREPNSIDSWFNLESNVAARFTVDDYKVKLFESTSFADAQAVYKAVQSAKGSPYLISLSKKGAKVYQVSEGTYSTAAAATTALDRWKADKSVSSLTGGFAPTVQGPLYLETGAFASKGAANEAANGFGALGLDAYVAVRKPAGGSLAYSVMVGGVTSEAELSIVQSVASKAPNGTSLKQADTKSPYLIIRNDHAVSGKADTATELYYYPLSDTKVWISPLSADPITFKERGGRSYRGSFELSVYNGRMAAVNELPFEHYLYSVVGAEMISSWPAEALKAQAVAARTYALYKGFGFQIAHVVDTTLSQAYSGVGAERASTIAAVDATAGEVMLHNGKLIEALFASNAGGITADAKEIWGNTVDYLQPAISPDNASEAGLYDWYRVVLPSGELGYIRMDLLNETGHKTKSGLEIMEVNTDGTKVRRYPLIQDTIALVDQLKSGTAVVVLDTVKQSNTMSWIRGPFTSDQLLAVINAKAKSPVQGPLESLEITMKGASGRATEISANGVPIDVSYPDAFRSVLGVEGSLPSTLFEIDQSAKVVVQGSGGQTSTKTGGEAIYTISAGGAVTEAKEAYTYVMDADGEVRPTTKTPTYTFIGKGNGHGVGLSQYGALGLAQQGYDYQYILKYYYKDITIAKE